MTVPHNKECIFLPCLHFAANQNSTTDVGYLVPMPEHLRKIAARETRSRTKKSAPQIDAALRFRSETKAFSSMIRSGQELVTDTRLRMGLTQHTVRSGAAGYLCLSSTRWMRFSGGAATHVPANHDLDWQFIDKSPGGKCLTGFAKIPISYTHLPLYSDPRLPQGEPGFLLFKELGTMQHYRSLQSYVPPLIADWIRDQARVKETSVSVVVREILVAAWNREVEPEARRSGPDSARQLVFMTVALDALLMHHDDPALRERTLAAYHRRLAALGLIKSPNQEGNAER